jgi:hypothetical protein
VTIPWGLSVSSCPFGVMFERRAFGSFPLPPGNPLKPHASDVESKASDLLLFGVNIADWNARTRFLFLSAGALVCSLTFAALQEKVFLIEGNVAGRAGSCEMKRSLLLGCPEFKYPGFMTVLTTLTYMACAMIERWAMKDTMRKAPLKDYALLAVVTFLGMYFTNWYRTVPLVVVASR